MTYRMIVDWYAPGKRYIVSVPELEDFVSQPIAEGKTREEAVRRAEDMLDLLEDEAKRDGRPLPTPATATS